MTLSTDCIHTIVFEHSPDAIIVTNGERVIQSVNPAFTTLFGYSAEQAAGLSMRALYADQGDYDSVGRKHQEQDPAVPARYYNIRYMRKDGSIFDAEVTARMMMDADGRYAGHVALVRDVSAQAGLKEMLRSLVALSARTTGDSASIVRQFLALGRTYFGLETGMVTRIDGDVLTVESLDGASGGLREGDERPAASSCCSAVFEDAGANSYSYPAEDGSEPLPCFVAQDIQVYIGCPLEVGGVPYGALSFFSRRQHDAVPFSDDDRTLVTFLAEWLGGFLEQNAQKCALHRMGEDLRLSAENFKRLYRDTPVMMHSTDREGLILDVSEKWLTDTGYSRNDVIGRPLTDFYTPEWAEESRRLMSAFWDGSHVVTNEPRSLVRKDGSIIEVEVSGIVAEYPEAGGKRSLTVLVDVTERNRGRRELERNAQVFQRLYRETPAMMHSVDPDGRIVEVSDYWLVKMGFESREEVIGRPVEDFHPPEQRQRARLCVEEFWRTGEPVWNRAYEFVRKDGRTFEVELSVIVAKPKGKSAARSLAVSFDVTDRNRAWLELERKNDELQRLNEELDTFASVASHDLQEPLRKIRKFAEILEEELPESLSDDGAYALGAMRSAVQRMQRLIADLLDYARTANLTVSSRPISLTQVVERVNDDLSIAICEADARINAGPLPTIRGDEQQVRQLFQNLIENAVKYRDHTKRCEIAIVAEPVDSSGTWRVSVRDNGIGFDPGASETIFLPFRRLQGRSRSSGSGLGLTICGRIAERHGWSLKAQSVPGEGSTFTLEIPAAKTDQYLNAPGGGATGIGATQSMV